MILDPMYRFMLKHELTFRSYHSRGEPLRFVSEGDVLDVYSLLENAVANDAARIVLRNNDVVRLASVVLREDEGVAALLFRRSDPDATPQMFEHQATKRLRKANKTADDAVAVSSHLFIKLDPLDDAGYRYEAVLEEVPGIGRTYVLAILLSVLRANAYEYTDRRGEQQETHTLAQMDGVKGDRIGDAAVDSTIEYVELVRPADTTGLDMEGMVAREERMRVRLTPDVDDQVGMVRRVREWALARDWRDIKVRIRMPEDKSRLVSVA